MRPLTPEDLLPLAEFAARRREFFDSLVRYLDRYRRVRIGPRLTLVFENRQTLWFRIQDVIRVARLGDAARLQEELDLYNRLLPGPELLQAAFLIEVLDPARLTEELVPWRSLRGSALCLHIADQAVPASLRTCRPEDLQIGAAHWVQFTLNETNRRLLANFRLPARFEVSHLDYQHASPPLAEEVRQSLLEDLELSDRDRLVTGKSA
ncbi:MAG TPA: DUF3501 family protein [Gemmataceae bacterium]|jgi:hypothetical protein|nr:DUF3501 family protein [Gemmataceae bacterium]